MSFSVLCSKSFNSEFFEEYNCNCESYDNESLYEFFGFDVEDDVTCATEAMNSFCKNDQKRPLPKIIRQNVRNINTINLKQN